MRVTKIVTVIGMALAIAGCGGKSDDAFYPDADDVIEYDCETDEECEAAYGHYVTTDDGEGDYHAPRD